MTTTRQIYGSLTSAAKSDLQRLFNGWTGVDIRYSSYTQLLITGLIWGEQGCKLKLTPHGFDVYLGRVVDIPL